MRSEKYGQIFTLIAIVFLQGIWVSQLNAQQEKKLALHHKNTPLRSALIELAQKSQIEIIFGDGLVKNKRVSLNAENVELHEALSYNIYDRSNVMYELYVANPFYNEQFFQPDFTTMFLVLLEFN